MAREHFAQNDAFSIKGHWWRPDGQHRPAGELVYDKRRIELHLLGALDDAEGATPFSLAPTEPEPEIICGESVEETPISLVGSFYTHWRPRKDFFKREPTGLIKSTLHCNAALLGVHLDEPDEACFKGCSLTIPNLERWLDDRPFKLTFERPDGTQLSVTYKMPDPKTVEISDSLGSLRITYSVTPPGPWQGDMWHRAHLVIDPPEPKPFAWFIEIVGQLERFFTLLFGHEVQTTRVSLIPAANGEVPPPDDVLLFYARHPVEQAELNPSDFFTQLTDIESVFPQILKTWLTESFSIRHSLDLLFSSLREPGAFLESRFLPVVQAAEVFGRAILPGRVVDDTEFKRVRKAVVNAIPMNAGQPIRDAIEGSLAFANELRLKQRLRALIAELPETHKFFCHDPETFVRGIVDTRNYLTHYTNHDKLVLQKLELHWATLKLVTMLKILILKQLGVDDSLLKEILTKNHRLRNEMRGWKDVSERGSPLTKDGADEKA